MSCGGNGLRSAKLYAHAPVVVTQNRLAVMQRMSGDTQRKRGAVLHVAGAHGQYLAAADAIIWTLAQPGSKHCDAAELGQIRADFGQHGMNQQSVDTGNLGEVHSEDAIVLGAKVVVGVAGIHFRGRDFFGAR